MGLEENLRTFRKKHQLSQDEVAEQLMVTRQAVSRWETGKSLPDVHTLSELANIYGVTIDELLKGEEPSEAKGTRSKDKPSTSLLIKHYEKYLYILLVVFVLVLTLPKDIGVPTMFFGKLIIIFFIMLVTIYFIIKNYLS